VKSLPEDQRNNIEADSYWCMSKFLDSIQVNYIFAQTGIQEKVKKLKELMERIDSKSHTHFLRTCYVMVYAQKNFDGMQVLFTCIYNDTISTICSFLSGG